MIKLNRIFTPFAPDEFGFVKDRWVHDSEIVGICLPDQEQQTLKVILKSESGEEHEIEFEGVLALSCSSFSTQNVVFEILLQTKADLDDEIKMAFSDRSKENLKKLSEQVKEGACTFAHFQPSVGCEIKLVFERLKHSYLEMS